MLKSLKFKDNYLVYDSATNVLDREFLEIPNTIKHFEKEYFIDLFPELYKRGIYIGSSSTPRVLFDTLYYNENGEEVGFKDKEDFINYFKTEENLYLDVYNTVLFTRRDMKALQYTLTDKCRFPIITEKIVKYIENIYMRKINSESEFVLNDIFGLSDHIVLVDPEYMDLNNFSEIMESLRLPENIFNKSIYIEYHNFYLDILNKLSIKDPLSVQLSLKKGFVVIEYFSTPTSRRYKLNIEFK